MTKEELSQLIDLSKEIKELEERINIISKRKDFESQDIVSTSYNDFPYIKSRATISGTVSSEIKQKEIDNVLKLLEVRKKKAIESERIITEYINTVEDSRIRRMMQYRYVEGCTLSEIGYKMNCDRTTVEKTISKYLHDHK